MAIRFCKGQFRECDIEELNEKFVKSCFKRKEDVIVIYSENKIFGFLFNKLYKEGNDINASIQKDFVELNEDIIERSKEKLRANKELEYIPIIEDNKVSFFAYNDENLERARNKLIELMLLSNFSELANKNNEYNGVNIYGVNEVTFEISRYFDLNKVPYRIVGDKDLLCKVGLRDNTEEISKPFKFFVEGNRGLSLKELPFWRTDLEWLEQDFQEIFTMYREENRFEEAYKFNDRIKADLEKKTPFMVGRIGNTELSILKEYLEIKENYRDGYSKFWLDYFYTTSGFFSKENQREKEDIDRYAELTFDAIKNCDYHEYWGGIELAEGLKLLLDKYKSKNSIYIPWDSMVVPNSDNNSESFISNLEGKKVLVISSYSESVKKQYSEKELLFKQDKMLPNFKLITYQSLETQLGNNQGFSNWFEAYRHMVEDIKKIDFDIALLCCGAYGFPLASEIKNMEKQSLELCSYLPNWFGIKIKRYATCEKVNRFWNSSWSFPLEGPPKNSYKIENSCYWQ